MGQHFHICLWSGPRWLTAPPLTVSLTVKYPGGFYAFPKRWRKKQKQKNVCVMFDFISFAAENTYHVIQTPELQARRVYPKVGRGYTPLLLSITCSTGCPKKTQFQNAVGATVHWLNHK